MRTRFLLPLAVAAALFATPSVASAFCRTTTCPLPADYDPTQSCEPASLTGCVDGQGDTIKNIPIWWRSACAGYSVQKDASKDVSLADAESAAAAAFLAWSSASCGGANVSIDVKFLGAVSCNDGYYKSNGPNQNAIVFRDSGWPHRSPSEIASNAPSPEIALTTMSFDPFSGEIYAGYIEINSADHVVKPTASPSGNTFDLQTVLTHEAGHFIGVAHSASSGSVMYFADREGEGTHRTLSADDTQAACTIYPPSGARPVDVSADPSGHVQATACDATPRHGFASDCSVATKSGCSCDAAGARSGSVGGALTALGLAATLRLRRRRARDGQDA